MLNNAACYYSHKEKLHCVVAFCSYGELYGESYCPYHMDGEVIW